MERARDRKERGNPPGKRTDPLGDQLIWEQILTHFKGKKRLWIISGDGDYGTVYQKERLLNPLLYHDLCKVAEAPEVFWFDNIYDGIKDFAAKTGVTADKLPTPEKAEEIKKEEEALPPLGWLQGNSIAASGALMSGWHDRSRAQHPSFTSGYFASGYPTEPPQQVLEPPQPFIYSGVPPPAGVPPESSK